MGPGVVPLLLLFATMGEGREGEEAWPAEPFGASNGQPKKPQLCYKNWHSWVTHGYGCGDGDEVTDENAGCNIPAYTSKWIGIHWNVANKPLNRLNEGYWPCPNLPEKQFPMPDYCSRAIVAELSQIYDGRHRVANTGSFFRHMTGRDDNQCAGYGDDKKPIENTKAIMGMDQRHEACWGFTNAYKRMWCGVYHECKSTQEDPNKDEEKVTCCKRMWEGRQDRYQKARILEALSTNPRRTFNQEKMYEPPPPAHGQAGAHAGGAHAPGVVGHSTRGSQAVSQGSQGSARLLGGLFGFRSTHTSMDTSKDTSMAPPGSLSSAAKVKHASATSDH